MKRFICLGTICVLNSISSLANAEVYKCSQDGIKVYSESPCGIDATVMTFENSPKQESKKTFPLTEKKQPNTSVITGNVIKVVDGDTITIRTSNGKVKIRFAQIDAPETSHFGSKAQPYGKEAAMFLTSLVANRSVRVEVETVDQYGRNVGTVYVDGNNINREMVKNGYAWVYREYAHDSTLIDLEKSARERHIGLWRSDNPIYPSDFRKENK